MIRVPDAIRAEMTRAQVEAETSSENRPEPEEVFDVGAS